MALHVVQFVKCEWFAADCATELRSLNRSSSSRNVEPKFRPPGRRPCHPL